MNDKLVTFLYILMRDHPGVSLHQIVSMHAEKVTDPPIFSDDTLEAEARKLAKQLEA